MDIREQADFEDPTFNGIEMTVLESNFFGLYLIYIYFE